MYYPELKAGFVLEVERNASGNEVFKRYKKANNKFVYHVICRFGAGEFLYVAKEDLLPYMCWCLNGYIYNNTFKLTHRNDCEIITSYRLTDMFRALNYNPISYVKRELHVFKKEYSDTFSSSEAYILERSDTREMYSYDTEICVYNKVRRTICFVYSPSQFSNTTVKHLLGFLCYETDVDYDASKKLTLNKARSLPVGIEISCKQLENMLLSH